MLSFGKYLLLTAILLAVIAAGLLCGSVWIPPGDLWTSGILGMRAARLASGILVGAGLAVSGAAFQSILRNPLADPYILGVSSGAGLGASAALVLGWGLLGAWTISLGGFTGAILSVLCVYALAREKSGKVHIYSLLLIGVMFNAAAGALLMFLFTIAPSDRLPGILFMLMGSLQVYDIRMLWVNGAIIVGGIIASAILAPSLNPLLLGDEKAQSLGIDTNWLRKAIFVIASLIAGACVSLCGLIGFIGLIVPHICRILFGNDYRKLIPACALLGAALLPTADIIARAGFSSLVASELPVGVITALMGAPFFIALMASRR